MFKGLRQAVGNTLDKFFLDKWPLDRPGHHGPLFVFFNPLQHEVYREKHRLANERVILLRSKLPEDKEKLEKIETRLAELRKRYDSVGLATQEDRRKFLDEAEKGLESPPEPGESSYERFAREQARNSGGSPERQEPL